MWSRKTSSSVTALLFMALLNLLMCMSGNARHYIVKNSEKIIDKNIGNLGKESKYHECYIVVQETRRIGGQCVQIRGDIHGCVAGSFIDPFHQDCL